MKIRPTPFSTMLKTPLQAGGVASIPPEALHRTAPHITTQSALPAAAGAGDNLLDSLAREMSPSGTDAGRSGRSLLAVDTRN